MSDKKYSLPKEGEVLDLLTGETTSINDILNENLKAAEARKKQQENRRNLLCDAMVRPVDSSEELYDPVDSKGIDSKNVRLYEIVIGMNDLSRTQERSLMAVILKSKGLNPTEIFAELQPDDNLQKDPGRAARRWLEQGKALAKKIDLPPIVE